MDFILPNRLSDDSFTSRREAAIRLCVSLSTIDRYVFALTKQGVSDRLADMNARKSRAHFVFIASKELCSSVELDQVLEDQRTPAFSASLDEHSSL